MIEFKKVTKQYANGHLALSNITFSIEKGNMVFLTGRSGAGKSTLLRLLSAIEQPSHGEIICNGQSLTRLPARRIPLLRRRIGMVFQDHRLLHDRTVFDNVALPLVILGATHHDIRRRVHAALDKIDLLHKAKYLPCSLSSGEQQRVGIARAVVNKPALLLADEPTGNLDPELSTEILTLFQQFNHVGVTVLMATHHLSLIARLPQRILTLDQGQLITGDETQVEL